MNSNLPLNSPVFLSGDEALAQGAYEAGVKVAASYPGTPATEILEYLAKFDEVDSQWSVNEKIAYEVALGASIAGVRSIFSAKHVGLNVAMDSIMTSAYTGVGAGFVIVTADDPGLHSSQNEQDNRLLAQFAKLPLLEPATPSEAREFVKVAFQISEQFDTPVMVRLTTRVAHTKENLSTSERHEIGNKPFHPDIPKYVMVPGNAYRRHLVLEDKLKKLKEYAEKSPLNRIETGDEEMGFIVDSVSYLYVKEIFPKAPILKLGMPSPFPEQLVREFAGQVKEVFVVEELEPFIENQVRMLGIPCRAKHSSYRVGELRPEMMRSVVAGKEKIEEPSTARKPQLCPGCPHRSAFTVLQKMNLVVAGDIGCYSLGALPPLNSLHTCLCMGSAIPLFEGFKKVLGNNVVGVIGDSTFVHTGIPGLINLAYNDVKGVIIILDNGTTAMTGNQPHPAVGMHLKGHKTHQLDLVKICQACGADHVDVVNPHELKKLEELLRKRMEEQKLTVIIARYPCKLI